MVDSGGNHTFIHKDIYDQLKNPPPLEPWPDAKLENDTMVKIYGQCVIRIKLGRRRFIDKEVLIADLTNHLAIWGLDMFEQLDAIPDFNRGLMMMPEGNMHMQKLPSAAGINYIHVAENCWIPSNSECIVRGRADVDNSFLPGDAYIAPTKRQRDEDIIVGHTVARVNNRGVPVSVLNPHPHPVKLRQGDILAQITAAEEVITLPPRPTRKRKSNVDPTHSTMGEETTKEKKIGKSPSNLGWASKTQYKEVRPPANKQE